MNIIKFTIFFFLIFINKSIFADLTIGPVGKDHLKIVKEYKVSNDRSIFLYEYAPPLPPHSLTVLLAKNCDCDREKVFYVDDKGKLFDDGTGSNELNLRGLLNTLYAGSGEVYKEIEVDSYSIKFEIIIEDIYQYRNPDIDKITAELLKFKWKTDGEKFELLEKKNETIVLEDFTDNEESKLPIKDIDISKKKITFHKKFLQLK